MTTNDDRLSQVLREEILAEGNDINVEMVLQILNLEVSVQFQPERPGLLETIDTIVKSEIERQTG